MPFDKILAIDAKRWMIFIFNYWLFQKLIRIKKILPAILLFVILFYFIAGR